MWPLIILFIVIVAAVFFLGLLFWGIKKAILLALNSVIGFFALYAIQLVLPTLVINWISVLLTAVFGIFGFAAVLLLHAFGIWF